MPGADLNHVTYGLWRTKILPNCSKSLKTVEVLVLILIFIQMWRTRKSFLNSPLKASDYTVYKQFFNYWYNLLTLLLMKKIKFIQLLTIKIFQLLTALTRGLILSPLYFVRMRYELMCPGKSAADIVGK